MNLIVIWSVKNDSCSTYAKMQYIASICQLVKLKLIFLSGQLKPNFKFWESVKVKNVGRKFSRFKSIDFQSRSVKVPFILFFTVHNTWQLIKCVGERKKIEERLCVEKVPQIDKKVSKMFNFSNLCLWYFQNWINCSLFLFSKSLIAIVNN